MLTFSALFGAINAKICSKTQANWENLFTQDFIFKNTKKKKNFQVNLKVEKN